MFPETVKDDRSCHVEVTFAEFRGCPQHGQVTVSCIAETTTAAEIRRQYADMQEVCRTGISNTIISMQLSLFAHL